MRRIDLGQSFGILANVGVLVGILLLVYELNQNRALMAAQTRDSLAQATVSTLQLEASDSVLADLVRRANAGEQLTPTEREQFTAYTLSWIRLWEDQHYQYRVGLYEETEFAVVRRLWTLRLQNDAMREVWCLLRENFSPEFFNDVNEALGARRCE